MLLDPTAGLAVHDGVTFIGTVIERGDGFHAFDARGRCIGMFETRLAAMRSIPNTGGKS